MVEIIEREETQTSYQKAEIIANRQMSFVNATAGLLAIIILMMYVFKLFTIPDDFFPVVCVMFPVIAAVLSTPLFFVRNENIISKHWYKYFILFSLLAAIIALNIVIPKHSLLFWPFAILIANHYYDPRVGRLIYGVTIVSMLACMYLGMFFGEFDENLFGGGVIMADGTIGTVEALDERLDLLREYQQIHGRSRYLEVLLYYYFPRAASVTLFFMVSNLLNRRTNKLLKNEIFFSDQTQKNKTELEVAKNIQLNTLPAEILDSKEVEIVSELKAAKEVGGDLYDYLDIDDNHVAVLIGDVSGKGVPAAMFMMKTITSFRDFATANKSPSQILKEVNASIFKGNKSSLFVTCFLAILDKRNGKVVFANAGHNPPIVGSNGHYRYLECNQGFLLGCFKDTFIKDEEITLKQGESITLYTDGITEARAKNGEFFGEKRFLETMNSRDYSCVVELHHSIKDDISSFVKDAPQSDDITFLTLKYRPSNYFYDEKEFDAKKENIPAMLDFISGFGELHQFPEDFTTKLVVVGDELFSNIVNHGYGNAGGSIFVRQLFDADDNAYILTIIDKAIAFNQLKVDNDLVGNDAKKQAIGGLGIIIVKKIMDEYAYDRINGKNILVLKKRFKKGEKLEDD